MSGLPHLIERVRDPADLGRFVRYGAVSALTVPMGQILILLFTFGFDLNGVQANVLAVSIVAIPAFFLYRRWVWSADGVISFWGEVMPFWAMAFLGLVVSTLIVAWSVQQWDSKLVVNAANIVGYGLVWVVKFFVLDRFMFGAQQPPVESAELTGVE